MEGISSVLMPRQLSSAGISATLVLSAERSAVYECVDALRLSRFIEPLSSEGRTLQQRVIRRLVAESPPAD